VNGDVPLPSPFTFGSISLRNRCHRSGIYIDESSDPLFTGLDTFFHVSVAFVGPPAFFCGSSLLWPFGFSPKEDRGVHDLPLTSSCQPWRLQESIRSSPLSVDLAGGFRRFFPGEDRYVFVGVHAAAMSSVMTFSDLSLEVRCRFSFLAANLEDLRRRIWLGSRALRPGTRGLLQCLGVFQFYPSEAFHSPHISFFFFLSISLTSFPRKGDCSPPARLRPRALCVALCRVLLIAMFPPLEATRDLQLPPPPPALYQIQLKFLPNPAFPTEMISIIVPPLPPLQKRFQQIDSRERLDRWNSWEVSSFVARGLIDRDPTRRLPLHRLPPLVP